MSTEFQKGQACCHCTVYLFERIDQDKFDNIQIKSPVKYFDIFVCKIKRMD